MLVILLLLLLVGAPPMGHADPPAPPGKTPSAESRSAPGSSWLGADRAMILAVAGGSILVAGVVLWTVLGSGEDGKTAKPDLGKPPGDPVVQGAE